MLAISAMGRHGELVVPQLGKRGDSEHAGRMASNLGVVDGGERGFLPR